MLDAQHAVTRAHLTAAGLSRRAIHRAVAAGTLVRVRRDRYMSALSTVATRQAVRVGGRLTCLSLLQLLGVFVFENTRLHVHIARGASRLRSTGVGSGRLQPIDQRSEVLHWMPLLGVVAADSATVGVLDALAHAVLCQAPRLAVATIDSAVNKKLIRERDLPRLFDALPARFAVLERLVDGRAQSGSETIVRLWVRAIGCLAVPQVWFVGIGFVDLVVDGWLVIECDSKQFHSSWEQQLKDYRRDLALAQRGYVVLRLTAEDILYRPERAQAAIRGVVDARRAAARV
jgi:very-short-patch-repair endonuclease